MKRKSSYLDGETDVSPWISGSPLSDSSFGSLTSPDRAIKPVPRVRYSSASTINISGPNPRTRKRYRDNRPDVNMIHQNTLAKLYNAQKAEQSAHSDLQKPLSSLANNTVSQREDHQHAPVQKSLHSFFNIRQPQPTMSNSAPPVQHGQDQADLCSGCGNHLINGLAGPSGDDMMEVDHNSAALMDEDFDCASCQRRVCDTCAVRGDQRICLECALPGKG